MSFNIATSAVPHYNCTEHLLQKNSVMPLITLVKISPQQLCCYQVGHLEIFFLMYKLPKGEKEAVRERLLNGTNNLN